MFLNNILYALIVSILLLLSACALPPRAGLPPYTPLPVIERPSVNFGARRPNYVILHHTSDDPAWRGRRQRGATPG